MSTNDAAGRGSAEPIDVEFEPAEHRERAYRRPPPGGVSFGTALTLAVLAAAGGATAGALAPRVPQVREALDKVIPDPDHPAQAGQAGGPNAALEQRLAAVEGVMNTPLAEAASAGEGGGNVTARVFALQSGLRDVQQQLTQIPSSTQIAGLTSEVQTMQQSLPAIQAAAKSAEDAAHASYAIAAASEASRSSGPFVDSYQSLQALLPDNPDVVALGPLAPPGAPTRNELRERFNGIENDIIRAAAQAQAGAGFWGRIQAALAQWVTVRRDNEGDTPAGVVSRAENRLAAEDLAGAVQQVNRLNGPAAQVAAPWLRDARKRLEIDTRLVAIRTALSRSS